MINNKIKRNFVHLLYWNNHHFGRKAQLNQSVKPSVYNQLLNETACNFLLCDYKNEILQLDRAYEFAQPFAPSHRLLTLSNKFSKWYMVSMIPMNTSRSKRAIVQAMKHGSSIMDHVSREQPCLKYRYTAISRKVVGKSARDNPERYCGWF